MTKLWTQAFWGEPDNLDSPDHAQTNRLWILAPIAAMCLVTVGIGLWAEGAASMSSDAAAQLLDSTLYIEAVLGTIDATEQEALP